MCSNWSGYFLIALFNILFKIQECNGQSLVDHPLPDHWKIVEVSDLPPKFAPKLSLKGRSELRFSPGMFDHGSEYFWTYMICWSLPVLETLTHKSLQDILAEYYDGLVGSTLKRVLQTGETSTVTIEPGQQGVMLGTARLLDPFVTQDMIDLNLCLYQEKCHDTLYVVIVVSPLLRELPVWELMKSNVNRISCDTN